jgi:glycerol kinase
MDARGLICGLSRGTQKAHLVRAALEAIAYQSADVLKAMEKDSSQPLQELRVDGGAAQNNFLLQFQSDLLQIPVSRPLNTESTALGAARLAGLYAGSFQMETHAASFRKFLPAMPAEKVEQLYRGWQKAVKRTAGAI